MGFETFRVELRNGTATFSEADEAVKRLPHIKPDHESVPLEGSKFYVLNDGRHVIEFELTDSSVKLSCRFTLCHPPSIDSFFLETLQEMMLRLRMEATIRDDVQPAHSRSFTLLEFPDFAAIAKQYISARRAKWIQTFGDRPMAATTNELYQRIILPQCQPVIEQPI